MRYMQKQICFHENGTWQPPSCPTPSFCYRINGRKNPAWDINKNGQSHENGTPRRRPLRTRNKFCAYMLSRIYDDRGICISNPLRHCRGRSRPLLIRYAYSWLVAIAKCRATHRHFVTASIPVKTPREVNAKIIFSRKRDAHLRRRYGRTSPTDTKQILCVHFIPYIRCSWYMYIKPIATL
jgi:hypothetical protein